MQKKKIIFFILLTMIFANIFPKIYKVNAKDFDPLIIYSTYFGGSEMESINKVLIDSQGNIIIVGETFSPDFPIHNGFQLEYGGGVPNTEYIFGGDGFVTKLNSSGQMLWSSYFGGSGLDQITAAVLDAEDNILICGNTGSKDLPISSDAFVNNNFSGAKDGFVAKIESNGSLLYTSYIGGLGEDFFQSCAIDFDGNLYITGMTNSANFPTSSNAAKSEISGKSDAFLLKLSADLKTIIYCSFLGGNDEDIGTDIEIDQNSSVLISGSTFRTENIQDIFISKINGKNLTELQYTSTFSSLGRDDSYSIVSDSMNNIIIAGRTFSTRFPVQNPIQTSNGEGEGVDALLIKIDPLKEEVSFSTYFGGLGWDTFYDIAIYQDDEIYLCGDGDENFPLKNPFQAESAGSGDCVITKFNSKGDLKLSSFFGGSSYDHCLSIEIEENRLFIAGFTRSSDFNITSDAFQPSISSGEDGFLTIFNLDKLNVKRISIGITSAYFILFSLTSICGIFFHEFRKQRNLMLIKN